MHDTFLVSHFTLVICWWEHWSTQIGTLPYLLKYFLGLRKENPSDISRLGIKQKVDSDTRAFAKELGTNI